METCKRHLSRPQDGCHHVDPETSRCLGAIVLAASEKPAVSCKLQDILVSTIFRNFSYHLSMRCEVGSHPKYSRLVEYLQSMSVKTLPVRSTFTNGVCLLLIDLQSRYDSSINATTFNHPMGVVSLIRDSIIGIVDPDDLEHESVAHNRRERRLPDPH